MKKLFIALVGLTMLGNGCQVASAPPVDFCASYQVKAQSKITSFKISEQQTLPFSIWKKVFIEENKIDEHYFTEHIFPFEIREFDSGSASDRYKTFSVGYYFKPVNSDIYLEKQSDMYTDAVIVKAELLKTFQVESLVSALNQLENKKELGAREPHPSFGATPQSGIYNYAWGKVIVKHLSAAQAKLPSAVTCQAALQMLRTCDERITAREIVYKSALGYAWMGGDVPKDQKRNEHDCATATVDLQQGAMNSCFKGCLADFAN